MLRDFGLATVVDLTTALLGVMLALPALLVWLEERGLREQAEREPLLGRLRVRAGTSRPGLSE
jgi:hypothetical protein